MRKFLVLILLLVCCFFGGVSKGGDLAITLEDPTTPTYFDKACKDNVIRAVRLLLEDAIEGNTPSKFDIKYIDRYAADINIMVSTIDRYSRTYKVSGNIVTKEEYESLLKERGVQKEQRISDMKSLLKALSENRGW